jgi:hypothetical protein
MPCPSHPPWLDNSNYVWWGIQVMKLLIMQLSPLFYQSISIRNTLYFSPQVRSILPPYRDTLHYHHLPVNQFLCDVIWSMSKSIHYAAIANCDQRRHCVPLHSPTSLVVRAHPPPRIYAPNTRVSCQFRSWAQPTDIKVQSSAMKEGAASLIFTGQDVLSQLAGCISGCHLPHIGGKVSV